jgi:BatD DUF11 like domain
MSRIPRFVIPIFGLSISWSSLLLAQPGAGIPSSPPASRSPIAATVLSDRIAVGEIGTFVIKAAEDVSLPEKIIAIGLDIVQSGTQSSMTSINGRMSVDISTFYRFRGDQAGSFEIPPVEVNIGGALYKTQAIPITIYERDIDSELANPTQPFFAKLELTKTTFYVNELVPFSMTGFVRGRNSINEVASPTFEHPSFIVRPFREVRRDGNDLGNTYYTSATIPSMLFALKPGEHRLGPAQMAIRVLDNATGFGFSNFFPRTVLREIPTNAVTVTVVPLPGNAPMSFTGGVGDFVFSATANSKEVALGDPISIDFEVKGVGNLRTMTAPVFAVPQKGIWKSYEASKTLTDEEDSDGSKEGIARFSQVIIPEAKVDNIPAYELTYFDPEKKEYVTRRTEPIPVSISADAPSAQSGFTPAATGNTGALASPDAVPPSANFTDVLHIRTGNPRWIGQVDLNGTGPWYLLVQGIFSIAFSMVVGVGIVRFVTRWRIRQSALAGVSTYRDAMKALPPLGSSRQELYRATRAALDIWRRENPSPRPEAKAIVERLSRHCEQSLYSGESENQVPLAPEEDGKLRRALQQISKG